MKSNPIRLALLSAACFAAVAQAQVTPPPLPPGSHMVRVEPGLNEEERKRHVRAHHHKAHHHKDVARDDSVHGPVPSVVRINSQPGNPGGATSGSGAAPAAGGGNVQGGAGTGPTREKTDRGAGSWFFGPDTKK